MDDPRVLKAQISEKLEELEKIKSKDLSYDGFENPVKLLKHYKGELRFFSEGKLALAKIIDKPKNKKEKEDYGGLKEFYLKSYPELELNLLRVISILEKRISQK